MDRIFADTLSTGIAELSIPRRKERFFVLKTGHFMSEQAIGRILRASTTGFAIGCRVQQLEQPEFGGLVKAEAKENEAIYGLIYDIHIDDDPLIGRLVMSDNLPQSAINDQRQNRALPLEMSALAIGYQQNRLIHHGLPPRPPLNLDPVYVVVDSAEIIEFTNRLSYLRILLRASQSTVPIEQLLVAHIRAIYRLRGDDDEWAIRAIQELIELLRSSYDILIPTLEALSDALPLLSPKPSSLPFP